MLGVLTEMVEWVWEQSAKKGLHLGLGFLTKFLFMENETYNIWWSIPILTVLLFVCQLVTYRIFHFHNYYY